MWVSVAELVVCCNEIGSVFIIQLFQSFQPINDELLPSPSPCTRVPLYVFLRHFSKVRNGVSGDVFY